MQHKRGINEKGAGFNKKLAFIFLAIMLAAALFGCSLNKDKSQTVSEDSVSEDIMPEKEDLEGTVRTVIIGIDADTGKIKFSHVDTGKRYELTLTNETEYFSKTGNAMVEEQLEAGDVADITASVHSGNVKTVQLVDGLRNLVNTVAIV